MWLRSVCYFPNNGQLPLKSPSADPVGVWCWCLLKSGPVLVCLLTAPDVGDSICHSSALNVLYHWTVLSPTIFWFLPSSQNSLHRYSYTWVLSFHPCQSWRFWIPCKAQVGCSGLGAPSPLPLTTGVVLPDQSHTVRLD